MENVKDNNGMDITIYSDRIDELLHEFYLQFIPEDLKHDHDKIEQYITESPQNRFNAALMYICNCLFKDRKILKVSPYMKTANTSIYTNNNKYDYVKLSWLCDLYIYYCSIYDKVVSLNGYSYLTGIGINTIVGWNSDKGYSVSKEGIDIYKKLFTASEQSLTGMLTGRKNPVGVLGILNHIHNWSMPGVTQEKVYKHSLTASDLPKLGNNGSDITLLPDKNETEKN